MTDITNIPLNKLTAWEGNVRKVQNKASIDELAASIKAHGLLQSLVVITDGKKFAVSAGGRRLVALQKLAKDGHIEAGYLVPCLITEAGDASEISLAENVMREDMHPADQFEAFRGLADKGMPIVDIAARFGKPEAHVTKLLKLARVTPKAIKKYRAGEYTLEVIMALTVTDDHKAQERVLKDFNPDRNDARDIRDTLTEGEIRANDKGVQFVTLKAYEKAGGAVKRDLFSEDADGVFISDPALLDTLVIGKLEKSAKPVQAEGWKWVIVTADTGSYGTAEYKRLYAEPAPATAAEQKQLDELEAEYEKLNQQWQDSDDDAERPERMDEIENLQREFDDRPGIWTPEQLAMAGAIVTIGYGGELNIQRGLVKPEDMPKQAGKSKTAKATTTPEGDAPEQEEPTGLSAVLLESLTAHRTAALSAKMLDYNLVGLQSVVYALVLDTFQHRHDTALQVSLSPQSLHRVEGSPAAKRLEEHRAAWGDKLPGNPDTLWEWCLDQHSDVLIDLLNFCAASSLRAIVQKQGCSSSVALDHADKLAKAVELDMTAWFTPTADNYFSKVGKPQILEALAEVDATPPSNSMKKADMARYAEQSVTGKRWLPKILR
ncbi:MAG TPA: ParB/RepB/Spo0J family partition protein [Bryobacteraceae bacterium]|nr:ParB/RepB/Spo0J family partition protein [Bryobacteraceae bacterium]